MPGMCHGDLSLDSHQRNSALTAMIHIGPPMEQSMNAGVPAYQQHLFLLQDNASSHTAELAQKTISRLGWTLLQHPAYSPDLNPSDRAQ